VYQPKYIWSRVKEMVPDLELKAATAVSLIPRKPLSGKLKRLLRVKPEDVVEGERSHRLWELECLLIESGFEEAEVFDMIWPTAWNKWRELRTGESRLRKEVHKAALHVSRRRALGEGNGQGLQRGELEQSVVLPGADPDSEDRSTAASPVRRVQEHDGLPFVGYASFMAMAMEEPKWLIEDIWTADSHGIIGGEPKTQKTSIALALALSVASGAPFLNEYQVGVTGPVLFVQEENAPWMMQDRLRKLASHYGLLGKGSVIERRAGPGALGTSSVELQFPSDLPLKLLNNYGFNLAVEEHRDMLWAEVERERPKLLILDPMYLILAGADQNQASSLVPFLQWILQLRYEFDCAVALIHHMRKQQVGGAVVRAGQRLMGSATLHGWVDSAIYTSAVEDERDGWTKTLVETEFRSMAPQKAIELGLYMGSPGDLSMEVEIGRYDFEGLLVDTVRDAGEQGMVVSALAEQFNMDRRTMLARCRGSDRLTVVGGKKGRGQSWRVYVGTPPEGGSE
jgi:hypothetical protein